MDHQHIRRPRTNSSLCGVYLGDVAYAWESLQHLHELKRLGSRIPACSPCVRLANLEQVHRN